MNDLDKKTIINKPIPVEITDPIDKMRWVFEMLNDQDGVKRLMKELADK